jgi:hypothetical protein
LKTISVEMKLLKTNTQTHTIDKHRKKQRKWDTSLWDTRRQKKRGDDITPSTSTTIERLRRNEKTMSV